MRIEQLDLERYGAFTDRRLSFHPQAALHVVFGANEAGKTSALAAIGDLLFGFGARTGYDFRHETRALRIGGRFRHSDGRVIAARRRKGNKNTLVDDGDQPLPDDALAPLLGDMSRETFSREFGLTAPALREGGHALLRTGGRLAEALAASSAGMSALAQVRARLQREADDLFTPRRAAGRPFYVAADRRDAADRALRDAIITRDAIRQAEAARDEARRQLDARNKAHAELGAALAHWQRTLRTRSHLAKLDGIAADLAAFADLPAIAPPTLAEWRAAADAQAALEAEMAALDAADAADAAEITSLAVDDRLLAAAPDIDALRERLGAVRKARDDLPRRQQARDAAQAALDALARRLGLPSHAELLPRTPNDAQVALARDLIAQMRTAEDAILEADRRRIRLQQERDGLAAEDSGPHVADIAQLRQRFDALGDLAALAERHRRAAAAFAAEMQGLGAEAAALDPAPGDLQRLPALPLPDAAAVARHAHALEAGETAVRRLAEALAAADSDILATETELAGLSHAGGEATRAALAAARRERDAYLTGLRALLDGELEQRRQRFEELHRASAEVDRITDLLLSDTERATRREDAQQRLAARRRSREPLVAQHRAARAALAEEERAWEALWAPLALTPRAPADMLRWRERIDGILARLHKLAPQKIEIDALAEALRAGGQAAAAFLESVGRTPDRGLAAEVLFREAKGRLDQLNAAWADGRARAVAKQRTARDLAEAEAERARAAARLDELRAQWPAAMADIGLPAHATPAQAQAALDVWHAVPAHAVSHQREGRSVQSIEGDLHAFEQDVAGVAQRGARQLAAASTHEALAQMLQALDAARRDREIRERLRAQAAKRMAARQALRAKRDTAAAALEPARRLLAATDAEGLRRTLERLATRHRLEAEQAALRRDFAEIADGRDERALRQERAGIDLDVLPGEIERATLRQRQLLKDIEDASVAQHRAQAALDALIVGRNAAQAAAERADASTELLAVAEAWLLRAAASRLAARAIERYRARVQDPLVARASTLFAAATDAAFSGLRVDYGEDDQPVLVAQRQGGERVPVEGLSEGTRDQLFLALRLALLERWPSEPMPFIGDDLMTSFDDRRTAATLRLLAAAGERRQVILFTHHRHVADAARAIPDRLVDIIAL